MKPRIRPSVIRERRRRAAREVMLMLAGTGALTAEAEEKLAVLLLAQGQHHQGQPHAPCN